MNTVFKSYNFLRQCALRSRYTLSPLLVMTVLVGCSSNDEYLNAQTLPPIVIADNLDKRAVGQIYTVPKGDGRIATGELKKPLPPTLSANQAITEPRVQSYGGQSWLVVPKRASATWSQLILFLQSRNIDVVRQDAISATIETSWITEAAGPSMGFRYRIQLEAGLQTELTEVHLVNVQGSPSNIADALTPWKEMSDSTSHRDWFLKQIARGISNQRSLGDSLIASLIQFENKVTSTSINGEPILELLLDQGRAFASVLNSISDGEFQVSETDESKGVIYFTKGKINTQKDERKFTQKLIDFLDKVSTARLTRQGLVTSGSKSYSLADIIDRLPNEDSVNELFPDNKNNTQKLLPGISGYLLIQRTTFDNKQRFYIRDGYGRMLQSSEAKQLLDTIRQSLI